MLAWAGVFERVLVNGDGFRFGWRRALAFGVLLFARRFALMQVRSNQHRLLHRFDVQVIDNGESGLVELRLQQPVLVGVAVVAVILALLAEAPVLNARRFFVEFLVEWSHADGPR